MQSIHEGALTEALLGVGDSMDNALISTGAYVHTGDAFGDAVAVVGIPAGKVRLSNIYARESWRHRSFAAQVCVGQVIRFR